MSYYGNAQQGLAADRNVDDRRQGLREVRGAVADLGLHRSGGDGVRVAAAVEQEVIAADKALVAIGVTGNWEGLFAADCQPEVVVQRPNVVYELSRLAMLDATTLPSVDTPTLPPVPTLCNRPRKAGP